MQLWGFLAYTLATPLVPSWYPPVAVKGTDGNSTEYYCRRSACVIFWCLIL